MLILVDEDDLNLMDLDSSHSPNLIFVGFKSAGKSTIGELVSNFFNYAFLDLDRLIEDRIQRIYQQHYNCREFYLKYGKEAFRQQEHECLQELTQSSFTFVLATGGGVGEYKPNHSLLKNIGYIIFLDVSFDILKQRLASQKDLAAPFREAKGWEDIYKIWDQRRTIYQALADLIISISQESPPEKVMEEIIQRLPFLTQEKKRMMNS